MRGDPEDVRAERRLSRGRMRPVDRVHADSEDMSAAERPVSCHHVQPEQRMHGGPEALSAPNDVPERRLVRVLAPHNPLRKLLRGPAKRQEQLRHVRQALPVGGRCRSLGGVLRGTMHVGGWGAPPLTMGAVLWTGAVLALPASKANLAWA